MEDLANLGAASAQYNLGLMYRKGDGVPADPARAALWLGKAAAQGHDNAQLSLGLMYLEGGGVTKDDKLAAQWFAKAAAQGQAPAMYNLGVLYRNGDGVKRDNVEALKYWILAEARGFELAKQKRPSLEGKMKTEEVAAARRRAFAWPPSGSMPREVK